MYFARDIETVFARPRACSSKIDTCVSKRNELGSRLNQGAVVKVKSPNLESSAKGLANSVWQVIVGFGIYESMDKWAYLGVCGGLAAPLLLQPLLLPALTKEASVPLAQRFCTKANLWIAVYSFLGKPLPDTFMIFKLCTEEIDVVKQIWRSTMSKLKNTICTDIVNYPLKLQGALLLLGTVMFWTVHVLFASLLGPQTPSDGSIAQAGNYWGTHYFYCVLKAQLGSPLLGHCTCFACESVAGSISMGRVKYAKIHLGLCDMRGVGGSVMKQKLYVNFAQPNPRVILSNPTQN